MLQVARNEVNGTGKLICITGLNSMILTWSRRFVSFTFHLTTEQVVTNKIHRDNNNSESLERIYYENLRLFDHLSYCSLINRSMMSENLNTSDRIQLTSSQLSNIWILLWQVLKVRQENQARQVG